MYERGVNEKTKRMTKVELLESGDTLRVNRDVRDERVEIKNSEMKMEVKKKRKDGTLMV